ncbi:Organic solvent tolerance-like N-temrinal domain-containing protein [Desulfonema limicola]|uniref:Organic solvent tolerance-like N-temrinal domain-containing protein n=1 Tax=Desulfonema limicola TaxID=45656 RepID=A0A975B4G6_9BACT|nr:LptA/OstA family protein [Desulfonema limicola]QTA78619.1 Organic solvent tolerance-like N-temrinal domain-containing protein [Desulfonema limicola]
MRGFHYNISCMCFWALILLINAGNGYCQTDSLPAKKGAEKERIHISAQSLVADDNEKYAEFIGNVKAVQGDTTINSESLKIYYEGQAEKQIKDQTDKSKNTPGQGQDSIKKIVATGSVKIKFDEIDAQAHEVIYTTIDRVLILNGPGAKVIKKGSGSTTANKITIYRDSGQIKFEGGVEGVFFPGQRDLN